MGLDFDTEKEGDKEKTMIEEEIKRIKENFDEAERKEREENTIFTFKVKVDSNAELNYVKETGRDDYDVANEVFGAVVENLYYCSKNKDKREENLLKRILSESGVDEIQYTISKTGERLIVNTI